MRDRHAQSVATVQAAGHSGVLPGLHGMHKKRPDGFFRACAVVQLHVPAKPRLFVLSAKRQGMPGTRDTAMLDAKDMLRGRRFLPA